MDEQKDWEKILAGNPENQILREAITLAPEPKKASAFQKLVQRTNADILNTLITLITDPKTMEEYRQKSWKEFQDRNYPTKEFLRLISDKNTLNDLRKEIIKVFLERSKNADELGSLIVAAQRNLTKETWEELEENIWEEFKARNPDINTLKKVAIGAEEPVKKKAFLEFLARNPENEILRNLIAVLPYKAEIADYILAHNPDELDLKTLFNFSPLNYRDKISKLLLSLRKKQKDAKQQ
ncbi:MAG: hypothetical protein HYW70_01825 [Candidatus Nealsonbacteria bacterium]|nr:hypothetical protein [Candidatus Nealsonbacteria bacterium]